MGITSNPMFARSAQMTPQLLRSQQNVLESALQGKLNNTGRFTLTAGATSTVVTETVCMASSSVLISAESATAATAIGAGVVYVTPAAGSFTVTHNSTADTDRTFSYAVFG